MLEANDLAVFPIADWIQNGVQWLAENFRPFFSSLKWPIEQLLNFVDGAFHAMPFPVMVLLTFVLFWRLANLRVALFSVAAYVTIAVLGVWSEAMTTLSLITTAIVFCAVIGIPIGIWCARSPAAWMVVRPVLDVMQTTPTFVYLVPVVMLFGVGNVPGEVAVATAAMPPLIRFTQLGICMVDSEIVEAGQAFGANKWQLLWEVQLPLAMPTILGGLNQTVLTAMVMSVVISMIGAEGLGLVVLQGIGRLDVGGAAVGGIAIVLLAIMLDRFSQALGAPRPGNGLTLKSVLRRCLRGERLLSQGH
ncbi:MULTISPECIES: ABC transporter permease [Pseudomonas]|uniref:ABC transporter permease n=1 Tax=Pseudomonas TaxID=286 RepID=UPI000760EF70|nr:MULTISPECIES: proline/glycine betaine ABC transporter permease [Pseudomonas]